MTEPKTEPPAQPHYRDRVRCNAKYFAAADLGDRDVMLTIDKVPDDNETMPDDESRMVIYFKEDRRGLVLNVTNGDAIAAMFGDDYTKWIGQPLTLYATETEFRGKAVPCMRIRRPDRQGFTKAIQAAAKAKEAATPDDKPVECDETLAKVPPDEPAPDAPREHPASVFFSGDEIDDAIDGYRQTYEDMAGITDPSECLAAIEDLDRRAKADPLVASRPAQAAIFGDKGFSMRARE